MEGKHVTEWCAGLPFVEHVPLDEEGRQHLLRQARHYLWRGWLVILLFPVLLVLLGIAGDNIDTQSEMGQGFLAVCLIGLVFVYLPLGYLFVRDSFRRRRGLRRDLKAGHVKRYSRAWKHPKTGYETFHRFAPLLTGLLHLQGGER